MPTYIATDLEGTLTTAEGWKSVRHYLITHGRQAEFQRFFRSQLGRVVLHRLGFISLPVLKNLWMADLARTLQGYTPSDLAAMGAWLFEQDLWPQRRAAVWAELFQHHAAGGTLLIVSGLYEPLLQAIAQQLPAERVEGLGTLLEFEAGRATGRCTGEICTGANKVRRLQARLGAAPLLAAYGDTGPDEPMLALSQTPTAVYPDPPLRRVARARGWRLLAG